MANLYVDKTHPSASNSYTRSQAQSESTPWLTIREAANKLQAGDVVLVKGNGQTYIESSSSANFSTPVLNPVVSGSSGSKILFRPYPGHSVTIKGVDFNPVIGAGNGKNYVIWEGFTVVKDSNQTGGPDNENTYCAALSSCTGSEIGYCTLISHTPVATHAGSVKCGVRGASAGGCRVHHCDISGFTSSGGQQLNHGCIVNWGLGTSGLIIEDNYFHESGIGVYDKDEPKNTQIRRNYFRGLSGAGFGGSTNNIDTTTIDQISWHIYDNVLDESIDPHYGANGCTIHDNLFRVAFMFSSTASAAVGGTSDTNRIYNSNVWNNVHTISTSPKSWDQNWAYENNGPNGPALAYYDYNIYAGNPTYGFTASGTATDKTYDQMQALGFELNSQRNVNISNVYDAAWNLKAAYQSAGRGGAFRDTVGPATDAGVSIVASILDTSRYGAGAYTGAPTGNNPPIANLLITNISSLTVDTDNTGSTDTDGTIASRSTNWGDGTAASTTSTPSHTYAGSGTYTITLTVTDDDGATDQDSEQVTVGSPAYVQLGAKRATPGRRLFLSGK